MINPFGSSFFICQAGWPVGWNWLLPPGVIPFQVQVPIQVQAHEFISLGPWQPFITTSNRSESSQPLAAPGQALAPRAGDLWRLLPAGCGSYARVWRGGWGGGGGVSGVGVLRTFGILLVLELALDDLGLGATAGALKLGLNPLDVLVILVGCQDCLQLLVCCLKGSGFIWVYTSTITLSSTRSKSLSKMMC